VAALGIDGEKEVSIPVGGINLGCYYDGAVRLSR